MSSIGTALREVFGDSTWSGVKPTSRERRRIAPRECFHCGRRSKTHIPVDGLELEVECANVRTCERRIRKGWTAQ